MDDKIGWWIKGIDRWIEFIASIGRELMRKVLSVPTESVAYSFLLDFGCSCSLPHCFIHIQLLSLPVFGFCKSETKSPPINEYKVQLLNLHTCIIAHREEGAKFKVVKTTSFTLMFHVCFNTWKKSKLVMAFINVITLKLSHCVYNKTTRCWISIVPFIVSEKSHRANNRSPDMLWAANQQQPLFSQLNSDFGINQKQELPGFILWLQSSSIQLLFFSWGNNTTASLPPLCNEV